MVLVEVLLELEEDVETAQLVDQVLDHDCAVGGLDLELQAVLELGWMRVYLNGPAVD